ncbi:hypothetical protein Pla175_47620 [Pirellulimonas nuda]|uniref:PEP-CTERM protein-sorting domain-containing protein n=1 Tax=Pirellulimonas nuda TaxID=2528009 RepID=A0A518DIN4_9BACT|nr:hypothetical protein [Pirellulimonas nuda]QDU91341.1 hypothetical protein Pla175_47620 [Pirellulimonas nuda]
MLMRICTTPLALMIAWATCLAPAHAAEVVAFWDFAQEYDFDSNPNKQGFPAKVGVDAEPAGNANLQAYLGVADELDDNGGGGFVSYTSATSGIAYGPSRTLKFDDIKGGGADFDIGGVSTFTVDKNDGAGPVDDNFGNDALIYITLNGAGFRDLQIRFDVEGDPAELPSTFDIFYRTDGPAGTWYRASEQYNNIGLSFIDYNPIDPENQYADSGLISLPALLNGAPSIELILNDFAENGNGEMELDNIEIIGQRVPEPAAGLLLAAAGCATLAGARRRGARRVSRGADGA